MNLNLSTTVSMLREDEQQYNIAKLNLLAFPRNQQPVCELTGTRATVQLSCANCTLYYASEELAEQAWHGIIKKISHLLPPLIEEAPIVGTQEERQRRAKNITLSKRSLIEFCLSEASNLLSVKKYQLVIPAAIQALKFCQQIDGDRSISSVEPYLQLAHSYLGLSELKKSEEYLALARWIVLNSEECSDRTRSHLHMLVGRVYTAQGNFIGAKPEYANSIYYSSRYFGAESISTAIGYFRLGDVFLAEGNVESALAFFDKVVDIWFKYLTSLRSTGRSKPAAVPGTFTSNHAAAVAAATSAAMYAGTPAQDMEQLTEENLSDGYAQLEKILENRRRLLGSHHIASGEVQYTLGLFEFFLLGNEMTAELFVSSALKIYGTKLGSDHSSTEDVKSMLDIIRQTVDNPGTAVH